MDTIKMLNQALAYVEENLEEELDYSQMARIAGCSEYHFKRMFSFLAGISLGDYVRRRRLAKAASLLQTSDVKIIDLALTMGYSSPDAFAKAFSAMHGISPKEARKEGVRIKAFPPVTFQLKIQGGNEMNYRIVEKEEFHIAGICKRIKLIYSGANPEMDSMWQQLTADDFKELKALNDVEPRGILCVSANFTEGRAEGTELDQYIGVALSKEAPNRWADLPVESATWAVFSAEGKFPDALQDVWARIYAEWFPGSGYELTGGPEILWNESPDTSLPNYKSEIWVPVKKRS